jgi:hypothetical protein
LHGNQKKSVARDDEHTTLEDVEHGERLAVEVVGRLIHAGDAGTAPSCGIENDLDLVTTGETAHAVVRDELGLKTKVGHVLLDFVTDEQAVHAKMLSLASVDLENLL